MSEKTRQKRYRRSIKGVLATLYGGAVQKAQRRGHAPPDYTLEQFKIKYNTDPIFLSLYNDWVVSGYSTPLKPSIDRLNNDESHTFSNVQFVTWRTNLLNANKLNNVLAMEIPIERRNMQGIFIEEYRSIVAAYRSTGINQSHISSVAKGNTNRKSAGGFKWTYKHE